MVQKIRNLIVRENRISETCRFLLKPTLVLSAVYLVALSAVLRANYFYYDDIQRACWGWPGWGFSRHLSNYLSNILYVGTYLTDISPLPQLMAIFIIALTCVLSIYLISGKREISLWQLIAAVPIGISPYFLECLSYKFDAPYMALSVFFSVLPLLCCGAKWYLYVPGVAVCAMAMSSFYQASSGIFPMLVILIGIRRWIRGEKISQVIRFYIISAAGFLLGLLVYRTFFMSELNDYATTDLAPWSEMIPSAIASYKRYIVHFLQGFNPEWVLASFVICVCFLWFSVQHSKQNKLLTFVLVGIAMIAMFALSFGVYPFLREPLFYPRAMYGIGCFIGFQGIFAVSEGRKGYIAKASCLFLAWVFFVFALTFGNALSMQAQYTDFRITEVIDDLAECETLYAEDVTLQITGSAGYAPGVENMVQRYPMIKKLVPVAFQGDGWWGEFGIRYYYKLPNELLFAETYDPPEEELPLIAENYYHTIRADEDYIWVDLH